jgi:parallel beta-helix repeat protein
VAVALLFGLGAAGANPTTVSAASGPKVAIIVGPNGSKTAENRDRANAAAAEALKYTSNVVKVYSPNATWSRVMSAISGASIVVYYGRAKGYPSPYSSTLRTSTEDGFGLNPVAGQGNETTRYYGEAYIRQIALAPNALVLLHPRAYAPGASEPGRAEPSLSTARKRVDNYGAGFLGAGAGAVVAETNKYVATYYIRRVFTADTTLNAIWKAAPTRHGHVSGFVSSRTAGAVGRTDPVHTSSGYTRSVVGRLATLTTSMVRGGIAVVVPPPAPTPTKTITVGSGKIGITIKSSNVTLDGYHITGPQATSFNGGEIGIYVTGTASAPLHNIIIRNCYIGKFGNGAIILQYVESFTIENCTIEDTVYAGIRVVSGKNGVIRYNTVRRTGVVGYQANDMNSYGIVLTDFGGAQTTQVKILSNVVEDVPQWHGIDVHGGTWITINGNTVKRTNRAIFLTTSSNGRTASDLTVSGNVLSEPTPRVDMLNNYPYNELGITVYNADRVTGTGNHFDGWPKYQEINSEGGSSGVSITGSVITNSK